MAKSKEIAPFTGFTHETFEFFMAIRFNNNREFFLDNRDWYERAVRFPALSLADALFETIHPLDDQLEVRPHRVVSRINRDVRFSNDKSPYRDYIWLAFRRPGEDRKTTMGAYFDISDDGASYGVGFYDENRPLMNALRRKILHEPDSVLRAVRSALTEFTLHPSSLRRIQVPDSVPEELAPWYNLKGFYVEREIRDFELLKSPALVDELKRGFALVAPLYQLIRDLSPEPDVQ